MHVFGPTQIHSGMGKTFKHFFFSLFWSLSLLEGTRKSWIFKIKVLKDFPHKNLFFSFNACTSQPQHLLMNEPMFFTLLLTSNIATFS